jgi:hypothetical protein
VQHRYRCQLVTHQPVMGEGLLPTVLTAKLAPQRAAQPATKHMPKLRSSSLAATARGHSHHPRNPAISTCAACAADAWHCAALRTLQHVRLRSPAYSGCCSGLLYSDISTPSSCMPLLCSSLLHSSAHLRILRLLQRTACLLCSVQPLHSSAVCNSCTAVHSTEKQMHLLYSDIRNSTPSSSLTCS